MKRLLFALSVSILTFLIGFGTFGLIRSLRSYRLQRTKSVDFESNSEREDRNNRNCPPSTDTVSDYDTIVLGRYSNLDYAYSVLVPKGMMGARSSSGNPNHGFGIDLIHPTSILWTKDNAVPKADLYVDASYDSAEYGSPLVVIKNSLEWLREKHRHVRLVGKTPTHLGSLRALRFVIAYEESGEAMIKDQIVSFRSQLGEGSDIVYTIELTTTAVRYGRDKRLMVGTQRSWIIDPLPNDYPLPPVYEEPK